jgi:ArsR family transcriptional regulator, lead/cadmium/zinc/bismuth-responsive transcriptional repressor
MGRPKRTEQLADLSAPMCEENVVHLEAVRTAQVALPRSDELSQLSALFSTLGDPTRLRIVAALNAHELCVCDLAATVGQSESAVSHHLRQLRDLGLVRHRREGRLTMYALDDKHVALLFGQASEHVAHRIGENAG